MSPTGIEREKSRLVQLFACGLLAAPATATPPPPPPGEVHLARLGSRCDGRYIDGRRFREFRLRASPGQRYSLVIRSHDMDAVLLVLDEPTSRSARVTLPSFRGTASIGNFQAAGEAGVSMSTHDYILRVQAPRGQIGAFKVEVNYDPRSSEIYHPGVDPARLLAPLEHLRSASGPCQAIQATN